MIGRWQVSLWWNLSLTQDNWQLLQRWESCLRWLGRLSIFRQYVQYFQSVKLVFQYRHYIDGRWSALYMLQQCSLPPSSPLRCPKKPYCVVKMLFCVCKSLKDFDTLAQVQWKGVYKIILEPWLLYESRLNNSRWHNRDCQTIVYEKKIMDTAFEAKH